MDGPTPGEGLRRGVHRAIYVKVRDGQVAQRSFYAAIGVALAGQQDVLPAVGRHRRRESAKFWLTGAHRAAKPRCGGRLLHHL